MASTNKKNKTKQLGRPSPSLRAVEAVADRIKDLQKQEEAIRNMASEQFGTQIPIAFFPGKGNFIVDP